MKRILFATLMLLISCAEKKKQELPKEEVLREVPDNSSAVIDSILNIETTEGIDLDQYTLPDSLSKLSIAELNGLDLEKYRKIDTFTKSMSITDRGVVIDLNTVTNEIEILEDEIQKFEKFKGLRLYEETQASNTYLRADFFGDGQEDLVVLLKDSTNVKIGIVNYTEHEPKVFLLGGETDPFDITSYQWVGDFEVVAEETPLWSNYDDDFIDFNDVPEHKKEYLPYNSIYVHALESCGGAFIYWKNDKFNWLQQE